ncbi:hypothetical protein [Catellatospora coxensis]|uniref:hypothetical protein n=1 Tax=Catellatospora coxensis TaxID=310354 RepID=UPI001941178D|nr:hypothetical protein [Catellatospora coxensis]
MVTDASRDLVPALPQAFAVLEAHVADVTGCCVGCYGDHGIWTPHPCTAHRWAEHVRMTTEGTPA